MYLSFGTGLSREANAAVHAHASALLAQLLPGVTDLLPGYSNLYIEYDAAVLTEAAVLRWAEAVEATEDVSAARTITIPVRYDGEDLAEVAARTGLSTDEVVRRHSATPYHVYALGFTPGFPFMASVDESLRLPRRSVPRAKVPAHSVAMANEQTGVYPLSTPGGWHLLGTTLESLYDPHRAEPFLLQPGDTVKFDSVKFDTVKFESVKFEPAQGDTPPEPRRLELLPSEPHCPLLRVQSPGLLDLVLDRGRFLVGRFGLSRSGPLDADLAYLANRLLGNPASAPLVELTLTGPTLEVLAESVLAFAGWSLLPVLNGETLAGFSSFAVKRGDVLSFQPRARGCRSYLAVAGGIQADTFMGSASVDLKGYVGRPLQTGDVLGQAERRTPRANRGFVPYRFFGTVETLRLLPGPQPDPDALAVLFENTFTVASADRMGIRLEGAAVPGGEVLSEAVPLGAVQVTPSGMPILLLHDRGTLGGYAKPAVLHPRDLGRAAQLRPGSRVRFVPVGE
ncbi:5-oxoprolinase subunit PxpB [soil metagenome]